MPPLKNLRQETFCLEWVKDRDDARAYKAAGYKCGTYNATHVGSHNLLKTIKIKTRILELERDARAIKAKAEIKAAEATAIDRAWVVGRLVENVDRSMQATPVFDKDGNETGEYQYEGGVANRGLELIGKDLGMWIDKSPLDGMFAGANVQFNVYLPEKETHVVSNGHTAIPNGNGTQD